MIYLVQEKGTFEYVGKLNKWGYLKFLCWKRGQNFKKKLYKIKE
jgi:hypothetical protein